MVRGGPAGPAVVRASWAPGRAGPDHRSEMTTQWLCGQVLDVLEEEGRWLRVRGPDRYVSWVGRGSALRPAPSDAAAWRREATAISLGVRLLDADEAPVPPAGGGAPPRRLPWGARVAVGGEGCVRLPDGRTARPVSPDALAVPARAGRRFPPEPAAVVRTGLRWLGAPYLWGGRTPEGADCSGLVQAIHAVHGVHLPRDSGQQLEAGPAVPPPELAPGEAGPGRSASGGGEREGDGSSGSRPGDLLFFGDDPGDDGSAVTHVAMVVKEATVLHAAEDNGVVALDDLSADRRLSRRLRRRLVGATRPLASG